MPLMAPIASTMRAMRPLCQPTFNAGGIENRPLSLSTFSAVLRCVSTIRHLLQVIWVIICAVMVDVVDHFSVFCLGYNAMFIAPFAIKAFDFDVTVRRVPFASYGKRRWLYSLAASKSRFPAFAPVLATVPRNEFRVSHIAPRTRLKVRLDNFVAATGTLSKYTPVASHSITPLTNGVPWYAFFVG